MTARSVRVGLLALACAVLAVPAATASAGKASLTKLTIGLPVLPPKMAHIGFYVARDEGFFKRNGLDVNLTNFDGGVKSLRGLASGSVDMGVMGGDEVDSAVASGATIRTVWGPEVVLDTVMLAGSGVPNAKALRGKKIGITDVGGFADTQAKNVLIRAHVPVSTVDRVSFAARSALLPALVSGRIDAAVFHVDDGLLARQQDPKLHVIASLYKAMPLWQYQALAANTQWLAAHGKEVTAFIRAMEQADRWMYSHKAQVVALSVKYTQEPKNVVSKAYDFLKAEKAWSVDDGLEANRVDWTLTTARKEGEFTKKLTYAQVIAPQYARATGLPREAGY